MLNEKEVEDILTQVEISPHWLLRHLAQETGVSLESAFRAKRLTKFSLCITQYV
jgi:methylphosphotriester-DNA--protein-cysteine methyltransferase